MQRKISFIAIVLIFQFGQCLSNPEDESENPFVNYLKCDISSSVTWCLFFYLIQLFPIVWFAMIFGFFCIVGSVEATYC